MWFHKEVFFSNSNNSKVLACIMNWTNSYAINAKTTVKYDKNDGLTIYMEKQWQDKITGIWSFMWIFSSVSDEK